MSIKIRNKNIKTRYVKGESSYALGEEFEISPTHVLRIVRNLGGRVRTATESIRKSHELPKRTRKAMVRMYQSGKRMVDLSTKYGVSITKVRRTLLSEKAKIRTRGTRGK